jgi:hypothetical protein
VKAPLSTRLIPCKIVPDWPRLTPSKLQAGKSSDLANPRRQGQNNDAWFHGAQIVRAFSTRGDQASRISSIGGGRRDESAEQMHNIEGRGSVTSLPNSDLFMKVCRLLPKSTRINRIGL